MYSRAGRPSTAIVMAHKSHLSPSTLQWSQIADLQARWILEDKPQLSFQLAEASHLIDILCSLIPTAPLIDIHIVLNTSAAAAWSLSWDCHDASAVLHLLWCSAKNKILILTLSCAALSAFFSNSCLSCRSIICYHSCNLMPESKLHSNRQLNRHTRSPDRTPCRIPDKALAARNFALLRPVVADSLIVQDRPQDMCEAVFTCNKIMCICVVWIWTPWHMQKDQFIGHIKLNLKGIFGAPLQCGPWMLSHSIWPGLLPCIEDVNTEPDPEMSILSSASSPHSSSCWLWCTQKLTAHMACICSQGRRCIVWACTPGEIHLFCSWWSSLKMCLNTFVWCETEFDDGGGSFLVDSRVWPWLRLLWFAGWAFAALSGHWWVNMSNQSLQLTQKDDIWLALHSVHLARMSEWLQWQKIESQRQQYQLFWSVIFELSWSCQYTIYSWKNLNRLELFSSSQRGASLLQYWWVGISLHESLQWELCSFDRAELLENVDSA